MRTEQAAERPNPRKFRVIRDLYQNALRLLANGEMLPELEAKAYFECEAYDVARRLHLPLPPSALRMINHEGSWFISQSPIDDAGRRIMSVDAEGNPFPSTCPDFLFWSDLMDRHGPWVKVLGVEDCQAIADMLAFDESLVGKVRPPKGEPVDQRRTVCMKALYGPVLTDDPYATEEAAETAEDALRRFKQQIGSLIERKTMAFSRHDMTSPVMTEPTHVFEAEVARLREDAGPLVDVEGFFEVTTK